MKEKIFFAFNLDDVRLSANPEEAKVSVRIVAARNRQKAKDFLARHYKGQLWTVVSHRDLHKGLIHA